MNKIEHEHIIKRVSESMQIHGAYDTLERFISECRNMRFDEYKSLIFDAICAGRLLLQQECKRENYPFDLAIEQLTIWAGLPDYFDMLADRLRELFENDEKGDDE